MSQNAYQNFFKQAQANKRAADEQARKVVPMHPRPRVATNLTENEARLRRAVSAPKRAKAPFPVKAACGLGLCLALGGTYLIAPESVEGFIERLEVSVIGGANASEKAAEKSKAKADAPAKAAGASEGAKAGEGQPKPAAVSQEPNQYDKLKQRKDELDRREKELGELEEELQRQKVELDQRLQQLETTRGQIAQVLKERVEVDQQKVNTLVDLYSNMKAKQAADVIGTINEDLAVEVLAKMKKKNAAEIMNLLSPEKARTISEKYTGFKRPHADTKG